MLSAGASEASYWRMCINRRIERFYLFFTNLKGGNTLHTPLGGCGGLRGEETIIVKDYAKSVSPWVKQNRGLSRREGCYESHRY